MLKTWRNHDKGEVVKSVIDYNFNLLSSYLSKGIKALSTQDRKLLHSDDLVENMIVFDTDEERWYKYSNGFWLEMFDAVTYKQYIYVDSWVNNSIYIAFEEHGIKKPVVQLYMKNEDSFIPVLGGVKVDAEYNVTLSTDLPFDGKVVIK